MAQASTISELWESTTILAMRPVFSSPILIHVLPASTDLYIPLPTEMWLRTNDSPVPAHIMLGSLGSKASEPMEETSCPSKTGSQWTPPSVVLKMPPEAVPT